jgi:hypothetical protein
MASRAQPSDNSCAPCDSLLLAIHPCCQSHGMANGKTDSQGGSVDAASKQKPVMRLNEALQTDKGIT